MRDKNLDDRTKRTGSSGSTSENAGGRTEEGVRAHGKSDKNLESPGRGGQSSERSDRSSQDRR